MEIIRNLNDLKIREYEASLFTLSKARVNGTEDQPIWSLNTCGIFSFRSFHNYPTIREITTKDFPSKQI